MDRSNIIVARLKFADAVYQILMFALYLSVLMRLVCKDCMFRSFTVYYIFAGAQVLSCLLWATMHRVNTLFPRPRTFDYWFLAIGVVISIAMTDEESLMLISMPMVIAGPILGVLYFVNTVRDSEK